MFSLQMHIHADLESLYKEVPKRLLPQEYGGEAGPLDVLTGEAAFFFFGYANLKKRKLLCVATNVTACINENPNICCIF
jgi:hypothetical protein